jgi:hypothetical protein
MVYPVRRNYDKVLCLYTPCGEGLCGPGFPGLDFLKNARVNAAGICTGMHGADKQMGKGPVRWLYLVSVSAAAAIACFKETFGRRSAGPRRRRDLRLGQDWKEN